MKTKGRSTAPSKIESLRMGNYQSRLSASSLQRLHKRGASNLFATTEGEVRTRINFTQALNMSSRSALVTVHCLTLVSSAGRRDKVTPWVNVTQMSILRRHRMDLGGVLRATETGGIIIQLMTSFCLMTLFFVFQPFRRFEETFSWRVRERESR